MTVQIQEFVRKQFKTNGVQVTEENIHEVAKWCNGEVKTALNGHGKPFIEVNVKNPINDRQKQAFVGDWVLHNKSGYKVYTDRAFRASFEPAAVDLSAELDAESEALARGRGQSPAAESVEELTTG